MYRRVGFNFGLKGVKGICTLVVDQKLELIAAAKDSIYVKFDLLCFKLGALNGC
jgi:hypothetical protein